MLSGRYLDVAAISYQYDCFEVSRLYPVRRNFCLHIDNFGVRVTTCSLDAKEWLSACGPTRRSPTIKGNNYDSARYLTCIKPSHSRYDTYLDTNNQLYQS